MTATNVGLRLSAQQEHIWSQQSSEPGVPWLAHCEVLLDGIVDAIRLRDAIAEVLRNHEILRTVFRRQTGLKVPFQVIQNDFGFIWQSPDLTGLDEATQTFRIRELAATSPDLDTGPTLNAILATLGPGRSVLTLGLPAMCADNISLGNLIMAVADRYASARPEDETEILQYADIAEWQDDLLTGDETRAGRDYWREYFRNIDFTQIPAVMAGFGHQTHAGFVPAMVVVETGRLGENSREFALACWQVFLSRILGQSTLVIGCETGSRKYDDLRDAIGPLATTLPLQFTVDLESPLPSLVETSREALEEAEKWQESFAWTQLEEGARISLAFEYAELPPPFNSGGVRFTTRQLTSLSERFELKFVVRRHEDALSFELHYDVSKLDVATVQDWSRQLATLLATAAAHPEILAWRLPLLDIEARQRLLVGWNQTTAEYPRECCTHELFEQQASRTPNRTAVRCQESSLSYKELNERSNELAHALRKAGAGPNTPVGLCVERGIGMIAGLLGILKAGAAYVPLSADHPKPRLAAQLEGAVALVTEPKFLPQLPAFAGRTICVQGDWAELSGEPRTNPEPLAGPEDLAYVIYTSGSTGVPKGVAIRHRNLVNYSWFVTRRLGLENYPDGLMFATVSTLSADLGNTCVFPSLIGGGCLKVIPSDVSADSQRLCESNERDPVDVLKIVPSHLAALLDSGGGKGVLPRKFLILGGEAFTIRLLDQIRALKPDCEILNHYGPTETTVGSLTLGLTEYADEHQGRDTVPIGRPIANTRIYILDSHREPVPPGVAGELYIAGDGVSAGYLNQPELTAERFLPDSFANRGEMYRTGDLARYLPDGSVEFIGRVDNQVKIRGFRIELAEVDAALCSHCSISQAITVARPDERGDARLVAYVVPRRDQTPAVDALREHLKQQIPDYMVPAAIVILPRLPLTPNGKIDRQNLPEPEVAGSKTGAFVPPRNPTEQVVAGIWAEVLRREFVGIDDNFFEIGGHSLLATQVISRVRRSLAIDPPLRLLFESPTVAKLAAWIDEARHKGHGLLLPRITRVSRDEPMPLSFAQQRLWVLDQMDPRNPLYNVPRALRMKGPLNENALKQSLNEILRRHESQRTTFGIHEAQPVQIIAESMTIAMKVSDLTHLPASELESAARAIAQEDALTPFDLASGPLIRAQLIRLAPDDHVFLLTAHHIISDAWSASIFLGELSVLYEAFLQGKPSPLPDLTIQYGDYSAWQRQWLQGEALNRQVEYWRNQLKGAPAVLELPADHPRTFAGSHKGAMEISWLSPELSQDLKLFSRQEDVTVFMTLLAVFQMLLSRYSGQEQIVIGTDVANRTTLEAESLIGFFVNLLAMRTDLSGNPTFRELLQRVRTTALGAYAHQDMPFDKLVEDLQPERKASHNPLVQVLFVMQNTPAQLRSLSGLELSGFNMPLERSKFDLALFMAEREDRLGGYWVYRTDLFEGETIRRWAGQFETLIRSAIHQPEARLSTLDMLSEEEKLRRDADKEERRQSQRKKLMSAQPRMVELSELHRSGEQ